MIRSMLIALGLISLPIHGAELTKHNICTALSREAGNFYTQMSIIDKEYPGNPQATADILIKRSHELYREKTKEMPLAESFTSLVRSFQQHGVKYYFENPGLTKSQAEDVFYSKCLMMTPGAGG